MKLKKKRKFSKIDFYLLSQNKNTFKISTAVFWILGKVTVLELFFIKNFKIAEICYKSWQKF